MADYIVEQVVKDGIITFKLDHWKCFHNFVIDEMLDYEQYVWRGVRCDDRPLLPSFDRKYIGKENNFIENKLQGHLRNFKLAARGRRGANPSEIREDNDWWALGQHFGLETPLLDWTNSPFVALFFAYEKEKTPQTQNRLVWAIHPAACIEKSKRIIKMPKDFRADIVEFFSPFQDENSRLVNQSGLFSRCTAGKPIDAWVNEHFSGANDYIMIKIVIPDIDREDCLRTLNKMNINHSTLFPDLVGASSFSNYSDSIEHYYRGLE